jgi:hypothetical protein
VSDERDRVLIGGVRGVVFVEHTRSGARIELKPRTAIAVAEALQHFARELEQLEAVPNG